MNGINTGNYHSLFLLDRHNADDKENSVINMNKSDEIDYGT